MRTVLFAIFVFLSWATPVQASPSPEVLRIWNDVKTAYLAGKFDQLDELIEAYQRDDARTKSGSIKAAIVYEVLESTKFLYGTYSYGTLNQMEAQADKWIESYPGSRAARITKAIVMNNRAWNARGEGYANTVTPEQWNAFFVYSRQAKDYLQSVKQGTAADPEWYATMLKVARGLPSSDIDFDALASEALDAHPDYIPIYREIVRTNLPQWGGTRQTLEFWIDRMAKASGTDASYARAYWGAADDFYRDVIFNDTDADWSRVRTGFRAIVHDYPTNWNINIFARLACLAQDKATTKELMERLGNAIDAEAWLYREMPASCREWASEPDPQNPPKMDEFVLVEAYGRDKDGIMQAMVGPMEQPSEAAAVAKAQILAKTYEGVQAYKLIPDPQTGNYKRPIILFRYGVIPYGR
ncbi:DUF4034 domain-containing protein [Mesorhizobium abyssinicae]|uniref:DUF4034 domain-containing protein n=1 Tax=Mesorhizobium abyssinicae TaxID=1209958 RepID=UPI002A24F0D1|nr:DUF4034 domain-containing protein [Mesorhizobium abyssinicae]MDX8433156.1 DUF4034 domain-containing protein [Mesorhizobium abyssinicae]